MKAFQAIRDWVDRQWRAPGLQFKVLLLPSVIPLLAMVLIGPAPVTSAIAWVWFGLWNGFVFWRCCIYLKEALRQADAKYDRIGKFDLAPEYHDTESATAAAERKHGQN